MIIYEVNIAVEADQVEPYRRWLQGHIRAMVALPGFLGADLFHPADDTPGGNFVVQYRLADRDALDRYLREDAPRMRAEAVELFGRSFSATRRHLVHDASFNPDQP